LPWSVSAASLPRLASIAGRTEVIDRLVAGHHPGCRPAGVLHTGSDPHLKPIEGNVFYWALGYFISYLPHAILAKAVSSDVVPGVAAPIGGLVLLPAAALGQLLVMPIFVAVSGGWRFASERWSRRGRLGGAASPERMVLFVCGGNQSRSAMVRCIARVVMASTRSGHRVTIAGAGVEVHAPGTPMTDAAYAVLQEAGIIPPRHRSWRLTPQMCRRADAIYGMTAEHRAAVLALAPDVAGRTHWLAATDIPEPPATSLDDHRRTAVVIQQVVRARLADQFS
jgi:protein-tyrosine-phosphatase